MLRKAQHIVEFALVVSAIMLALSAINIYVKRGLQARYKLAADLAYEKAFPAVKGRQYEPYYIAQDFNVTYESGGKFSYDEQSNTFGKKLDSKVQRSGRVVQSQ